MDWQEGMRRRKLKNPQSPSYLHELLPRRLFLDAEHHGNALRFINHVCVNPSCKYEVTWVNGVPHMEVIAARAVRTGEELTCSYGFQRH